ncbi:hypothetical protein MKZ38_009102 [Zalerion maritima]|uniref:Uncharacterized protein n=1 Tax=Zalerion maritima TaxID=339359 RepID=A0AAD5RVC5_9PEZI|nr:hypothetical protein MKZ38_009102 [Zalerion maritima]
MFLHSGASLHGHEYSHRQPNPLQNTIRQRSPLLRHALVHPVSRAATLPVESSSASSNSGSTSTSNSHPNSASISTASRSSSSNSSKPLSVRPERPLSEYIPRTEQVVRFKKPEQTVDPRQIAPGPSHTSRPERSLSVSFSPIVAKHPPPQSYHPPKHQPIYQQPLPQQSPQKTQPQQPVIHRKSEPMSEDEGLSTSELSDASQANGSGEHRKKRRKPRQSTAFLIAHPAPRQNAKPRLIQVRPKLLMQIQEISRDRRPRPSIDVFPSSIIAGSGISNRISQRFPRVFRLRADLGIHDVLLVKSENYELGSDEEDSDDDEDGIGKRELIAILSPIAREDRAEIVLADGSVWVATPLPNGSFEFLHTDPATGHLMTARWVRRSNTKPLPTGNGHGPCASPGPSPSPVPTSESRFTFSVINPLSRRHPIMASLTSTCLDILDSYTTVSTSSGRYPPTIANRSFIPGSPEDDDSGISMPERTTQVVDDAMKSLISVTAVWVALRQGWSPYCRAPGRPSSLVMPELCGSPTPTPHTPVTTVARGRSLSTNQEAHPSPNTPEPASASTMISLKDRFRHRIPRDHSPDTSSLMGGIPRRATSTGAAFMQRRTQRQSSMPVSDASDTERPILPASRRQRLLSGEWNIPRRGQRTSSPLRQPNDGGARLDLDDEPYSARRSADPERSVPADGGVPLSEPISLGTTASARLARQRERRSMPIPPRTGAATPGSERTRSVYGPDEGGVLVDSTENVDDTQSGYFDQYSHVDHDEHGGVPIGPPTASVYVEFEDKKRGKWKSLASWFRKIGNR